METFLEILKLGSVGIIAGFFSSYLSGRDHRNKKWWELRVSAYQEVINALSDLYYYFDRHFKAEIEYRELSDEYKDKLSKFWDDSFHKVRKAADSGAFLFSDEANSALREFINGQEAHHDSYWDYLDNGCAGAKKCLIALVNCSKVDLKINE